MHPYHSLSHDVDWAQARHQNETAYVDAGEKDNGADSSHPGLQELFPERITDPATWPQDIESGAPPLQVFGLQLKQTGARDNKEHNPDKARGHTQFGVKQLCATESQQDHGQQVGSSADHEVGKARDNGSEWADEILGRTVRGRYVAKGDPGGQILRIVGNQRQE